MPLGLTELGGQEGLDQVPSHCRSHCPPAHADNVHVIVLDPLAGREMIVDQRGANARNLVGTHGCTHAAAANGHVTLHLARRHSLAERGDKVRIVVIRRLAVRAEIDNLMAGRTELGDKSLLQAEPAVISGDADTHVAISCINSLPAVLPPPGRRSPRHCPDPSARLESTGRRRVGA